MKVQFWGTRGSLPVALTAANVRQKILSALKASDGRSFSTEQALEAFVDQLPFSVAGSFGGHSSCVEVIGDGVEHIILDLGSGARPLGQSKIAKYGPGNPQTYHMFVSHPHWDHLMGLPFFVPIYIPGNRIVIHGCHAHLESAVRLQMSAPCFPVDFDQVGATIEFDIIAPDQTHEIAGYRITPKLQLHSGDSYGYRIEQGGKSLIYSTDSEHKLDNPDARADFIDFFRDANIVIFDAMYSLAESISVKADWGHSSNIVGVELCQEAGVAILALFHHEPVHNDETLLNLLHETQRFEEITRNDHRPLKVISAYDGLIVEL